MSASKRMRNMRRKSNKMAKYADRHGFNMMTFKGSKPHNVNAATQKLLKALGKAMTKKHSKAKIVKPNINIEQNLRRSTRVRKQVERLSTIAEEEATRLRRLAEEEASRTARVRAERGAKQMNNLAAMMEDMGL
jgi:nitrogenase molybdenum-iron protein alpha/beta subunit